MARCAEHRLALRAESLESSRRLDAALLAYRRRPTLTNLQRLDRTSVERREALDRVSAFELAHPIASVRHPTRTTKELVR